MIGIFGALLDLTFYKFHLSISFVAYSMILVELNHINRISGFFPISKFVVIAALPGAFMSDFLGENILGIPILKAISLIHPFVVGYIFAMFFMELSKIIKEIDTTWSKLLLLNIGVVALLVSDFYKSISFKNLTDPMAIVFALIIVTMYIIVFISLVMLHQYPNIPQES